MHENLKAAIRKIEKAGNAFNAVMASPNNAYAEEYELDAYRTIFEYIISGNIRFGDYDWDALRASYEDEGILEVTDTLYEIHRTVSNSEPAYTDEAIPLEVVALFYTIDTAFHYPGMEGSKPVLYVDMDNVIVDFPGAFPLVAPALLEQYADDKDEIPGIFALMPPLPGALAALENSTATSTCISFLPRPGKTRLPGTTRWHGCINTYPLWATNA